MGILRRYALVRIFGVLLPLAVACQGSSSIDGAGESGGAGGSGGTGGSGGAGGSVTRIGTGGSGGVASGGTTGSTRCDETVNSLGVGCGVCNMTLEESCGDAGCAQLDPNTICQYYAFGTEWQRGCGYIKRWWRGDVGDQGETVWNESTLELVYTWSNGRLSSGCRPAITVGTKPECATWTNACTGTGGAGGSGGTGTGGAGGTAGSGS